MNNLQEGPVTFNDSITGEKMIGYLKKDNSFCGGYKVEYGNSIVSIKMIKNMETKEIIVLDTDDSAAKLITVTGWVSRDGRFFGDNEESARYAGCTHKSCDCGNSMTKGWTKCDSCRSKSAAERYKALPFQEWDWEVPVCDDDEYFFSAEAIDDYLEEHDLKPEDLSLVICTPNNFNEITSEYWDGILAEDGEIPVELQNKLDELNKFIATLAPASWSPSKIRTEYRPVE